MSKKLPIFKLEDYLSTREFTSPYMFGSSDVQNYKMSEILDMADAECQELWQNLDLGYTETKGMPLLRQEIKKQYGKHISENDILCFAGAEEGIYAACHSILEPEDHAIVITPCYQSLQSIPESICSVTEVAITHEDGWQLDASKVQDAIKPNTKLLLINFPHNPTGALISHETQKKLVEIARVHNMWIFSDEVYRYLELNPADRLQPIASVYEKGLSLGVMSKAFGLPGLRIGWLATQNKKMLHKISEMKHYLSICNSAPSELLALIGLRNKEKIIVRSLNIMQSNLSLLDNFMQEYADIFEWVRPSAGCIAFPKLKLDIPIYDFCEQLREVKGVVTLPASVYDMEGNYFRIGFGRSNMPEALGHFRDFVEIVRKSGS